MEKIDMIYTAPILASYQSNYDAVMSTPLDEFPSRDHKRRALNQITIDALRALDEMAERLGL